MEKVAEQVKVAEVNGFTGALIDAGFLKVANEEEAAVIAELIAENLPEDYSLEDAMAIAAEIIAVLEGDVEDVEPEADEDMVVEASEKPEYTEAQVMAAYGELTMAKEAGDLSEEEFEKEAASLQGIIQAIKGAGATAYKGDIGSGLRAAGGAIKNKAGNAGSAVKDAFKGKGIGTNYSAARRRTKDLQTLKASQKGINGGAKVKVKDTPGGSYLLDERSAARKALAKRLGATGLAYGTAGAATAAAGYGAKSLLDKYRDE